MKLEYFFIYRTPILYLAAFSGNSDMISFLFTHGLIYNPKDYYDSNPFTLLIKNKNVDALKTLLKYASFNVSSLIETPVMQAIRINQPDIIPLLIESGEDAEKLICVKGEFISALSLICKSELVNKEGIVSLIISKSNIIDIDEDNQVQGAAHWICISKSPAICRMVLQKGIDVNRFDMNGLSGPALLVDKDDNIVIEILELFLQYGFDLDGMANSIIAKPLLVHFCSAINPSPTVIQWLIDHGANLYLEYTYSHGVRKTPLEVGLKKRKLKSLFSKYQ